MAHRRFWMDIVDVNLMKVLNVETETRTEGAYRSLYVPINYAVSTINVIFF